MGWFNAVLTGSDPDCGSLSINLIYILSPSASLKVGWEAEFKYTVRIKRFKTFLDT